VTRWCKLLVLAAGLPAITAAADPQMLSLVMPEARMIMEVNVSKIMASPIGSAMSDAVHQGIAQKLPAELAKATPEVREQISRLMKVDWSRQVQDVVVAGVNGRSPAALLIVRSSLDAAQAQSLMVSSGSAVTYEGVPILVSSKPGSPVFAFLDNSIIVIGKMADVKAAIHRRGHSVALPAALMAQVRKYSQYDFWLASAGPIMGPVGAPPAGTPPAAAQAAEFIKQLAGFNGGVRFSPDLDLAADVEARTPKGAADMAEGLHWLTGMVESQARRTGQGRTGLEGLKYHVNGRHILLSLHVPEAQMRAGLEQMRAAQARRTAVAASQTPAAAPSDGVPPPPPGTVRVQSSDMGTVLIPVGKQQ